MYYVAVCGMRPRKWYNVADLIVPTYVAQRAARPSPGFLKSDTFRDGRDLFAMSLWDTVADLEGFFRSEPIAAWRAAIDQYVVSFDRHAFQWEKLPARREAAELWRIIQHGNAA